MVRALGFKLEPARESGRVKDLRSLIAFILTPSSQNMCTSDTDVELVIKCVGGSIIESVRTMQPVPLSDLQLAEGSP